MTPRLKPKNTPVTQNSSGPLRGKIIALCGTFKGETRETLKERVPNLDGQVTSVFQPKPTHVISTEDSWYREIQPRLIKYALDQSIPIVWVE
jgi:NAD-dependent DNA ligase